MIKYIVYIYDMLQYIICFLKDKSDCFIFFLTKNAIK